MVVPANEWKQAAKLRLANELAADDNQKYAG
jgi:hypothetical protein